MERDDQTMTGGAMSVLVSGRSALMVVGGHPTAEQVRALDRGLTVLHTAGIAVTVELSGLQICGSPLLEVLVRARQRAARDGASMVVAEPATGTPLHVRNLLALVGLTGALTRPEG